MPPKGFNSVSIDDETADTLDRICEQVPDCDSRADAVKRAAKAFYIPEEVDENV